MPPYPTSGPRANRICSSSPSFTFTSFNQLDLPVYESFDDLKRNLLLAINEGGEGFGFA